MDVVERLDQTIERFGFNPAVVPHVKVVEVMLDAKAEIERLRAERNAWRAACRYIYETSAEGGNAGRPIDHYDKRTWRHVVQLIGFAEDLCESTTQD